MPGDGAACPPSADMKRDCRTEREDNQRAGEVRTDHRSREERRNDQMLASGGLEWPGAARMASWLPKATSSFLFRLAFCRDFLFSRRLDFGPHPDLLGSV